MLQVTSSFYFCLNLVMLLKLCYSYRNTTNSFGQSYLLLLGLLGFHATLHNSWDHTHWMNYTLVPLLLNVIYFAELKCHRCDKLVGPLYGGMYVLLQILFLNEHEGFPYARMDIALLLGYTLGAIAYYLSHLTNPKNDDTCFFWLFFLGWMIVIIMNSICTSFTDISTSFVGIIWIFLP